MLARIALVFLCLQIVGMARAETPGETPGEPPASAPAAVSILERDQQFKDGSGIELHTLTAQQLQTLVVTAKVWGFLKYHHPAVTSGSRHWDFDLFRRLPALMAAKDQRATQKLLVKWVDSLGPVPACAPCVVPDLEKLEVAPRIQWLSDRRLLGVALSGRLKKIYANRRLDQQYYVSIAAGVGIPVFVGAELAYPQFKYPDAGFRLLAAFRFWNIVEYWFPHRDLIDEDWNEVLRDEIPRFIAAQDRVEYLRELIALLARIDDGHASLGISMRVREPAGDCSLPIVLRYLEGKFVVKGLMTDDAAASGFERGDVITSIDGEPMAAIVSRIRRYYGASNENGVMLGIARGIGRGACGNATVGVMRDSERQIATQRLPMNKLSFEGMTRNDRGGDTLQMLSPDVAYLKLSSIKAADVPRYLNEASSAKKLIVDIRNYPQEFVLFALGAALVEKPTPFATFTMADFSNPGAFEWGTTTSLTPAEPHYPGRVAILVDEITMSSAEYTAMALRAGANSIVVGSQTAGADGNFTIIELPGGQSAHMTGLGVFYPDRRPTQQVGLHLDVVCPNTIEGLRAGRDETLDCALRELAKTLDKTP